MQRVDVSDPNADNRRDYGSDCDYERDSRSSIRPLGGSSLPFRRARLPLRCDRGSSSFFGGSLRSRCGSFCRKRVSFPSRFPISLCRPRWVRFAADMPRRNCLHRSSPCRMESERHPPASNESSGKDSAGAIVEKFAKRDASIAQDHWGGGGHGQPFQVAGSSSKTERSDGRADAFAAAS